jgi:hypothetical protein
LAASCSFSRLVFLFPSPLRTKDFGSTVATAFIWSLLLSKTFIYLRNLMDFPNDNSLLSSPKANGLEKTLQWALVWTLSRPRWFCKEAWAVAISAHRNQPLTNSVIRKVLLQVHRI